jgi:hypothetical protein
MLIKVLSSMLDAKDGHGQENLDEGVAAVEYIVREVSRGRLLIPAHVY